MMVIRILICFIVCTATASGLAQDIPRKMQFADMELTIEGDAAEIMRGKMKKLSANTKFFMGLKGKFEVHAPLIQKVLAEQDVPDEFKYLCVMESSVNPAAVSSSNAVGYWQFKKETGVEVGLKIDHNVDERKNIIASTLAACKYLKKSNAVLNNWILSCQSYNVGLGGTRRSVDTKLLGEKKMDIDRKTHEYVLKFLSYVLLFRQYPPSTAPTLALIEYTNGQNKTLDEIAEKAELDKTELKNYNQWLYSHRIPDDKVYRVILPVPSDKTLSVLQKLDLKQETTSTPVATSSSPAPQKATRRKWWHIFNEKDEEQLNGTDVPVFMTINGIRAIQAKPGDNSHKLANQGEIKYRRFLRYNEMRTFDELLPGRFYYLDSKKTEASVLFHVVMPNETLWDIAQKYGITTASIMDKNRMSDGEALVVGRKLYLRFNRPENEPLIIETVKIPVPPKDTIVKISREIVRDTIVKIDTVVQKVLVRDPEALEESAKNTQALSTPQETSTVLHKVEAGQTMYFISKKYGTSVDSIKNWNNLTDNALKIGAQLIVKKATVLNTATIKPQQGTELTASSQGMQHIVQQGETLYALSKKYGVLVSEIIKMNNLESNALKQGMVLYIPKR